ncbi:MAG: DUF262 domain-containing protein [Nostoc sp.]|uniref:DUF262 domain-containing protein n=1 Tax=Nostoc sp. TaxID=1180 RepID=UPI002FF4ECD2
MNDKISVKPDTIYLEDLLNDIANGEYKIPAFQREFVWKSSQMLELFDSILKGYPIGSLLFWNTKGYQAKDEIGPYTIKKQNSDARYVLDGFQRISTLFGVLMNPKEYTVTSTIDIKDFLIYFDIRDNNFSYIRNRKIKNVFSIPLYEIYDNRELFNLLRELDKEDITEIKKNEYIDNARNLHNILHKYRLPFVEIKGGDIKSAVEIFSRINSTGTEISEEFMLSALSYNEETEFLISKLITELLNSLNIYNFEDLKRDTILDCISNATGKIYFDVKMEDLVKNPDLKSFTNNAYRHIKKAVEFLYKKIFVIDIRFLPYPTQLIFISEYFRLNIEPTSEQYKALENWFWVTTYSNYFTLYSLSQQRSAYQVFCEFAKGEHPDGIYKVNSDIPFSTAKYPSKLNFTGVRPKALQLFYLKTIIGNSEIQDREGIKELFIFSKTKNDRPPANIILRLSSEFEEDKDKKQINNFIKTSSIEVLERHFITQEMVDLYKQDKIEEFISTREIYLKLKERDFVEKMGITYVVVPEK